VHRFASSLPAPRRPINVRFGSDPREKLSDTRLQFVPYRGTGPALLDMIAGRIDVMLDQASNSAQQVRDGKIRPYAVTAKTRLAAFPDIPTDEAGLPGLYINIWHGLWAPAGTPKDTIAKLDHAAASALADAATPASGSLA
jgi:tripartite-type tricarboxylate transporter receptor subunit TctC